MKIPIKSKEDLDLLRKRAFYTLKKKMVYDNYRVAFDVWDQMGCWIPRCPQKKLDAQAAKVEELRLKWVEIREDNRESYKEILSVISYNEALEIIGMLTEKLMEETK